MNISTLPATSKAASQAQRQDSTNDQMFDLMTLANEYGHRNAAVYLFVNFFHARPSLTISHPADGERTMNELRRQLAEVVVLAETIGCYDAADWIKNRVGSAKV